MPVHRLVFDGYWRDINKASVPARPGLYCVYTCTYNTSARTVSLHRLLYIGQAKDINGRLMSHEKLPLWKRYLGYGQQLCYATCEIASANERDICESALIKHHKPPCNTEYSDNYPHLTADYELSGRTGLLDVGPFRVYQTR